MTHQWTPQARRRLLPHRDRIVLRTPTNRSSTRLSSAGGTQCPTNALATRPGNPGKTTGTAYERPPAPTIATTASANAFPRCA